MPRLPSSATISTTPDPTAATFRCVYALPFLGVLVVVGHNPTIERVQAWLTEDDRGFPAGAVAIIDFDGDWAELQPGDGRLVGFTVP